jgi:hypothetical protein
MSIEVEAEALSMLTPEQQLINRLDDDFTYLLHFTINPLENLAEWKQLRAKEWIMRLSTSTDDQNIATKLTRNDYLAKLLSCIQNQEFNRPFNLPPPPLNEPLPKVDFGFEQVVHHIPTWVHELKHREDRDMKVGGKDFETYFSSKLLDNGACAYLAVSMQTDSDRSAWMQIGPHRINKANIDKQFANEFRGTGFEDDIK